jgi:hypothetical protein
MSKPANPLEAYFRANQGQMIHKWMHYFDIYDRHFAPFRKRPITVLEFGVSYGGSLHMWRHYFGPKARIIGVDINPQCMISHDPPQIEVVIGDQEDRGFLKQLAADRGPFDIVIEDGGHTMTQQINTFEEIWPRVRRGGVYLAEDLHTSYWPNYGGGLREPGTFIEYAKNLIDQQNAWHTRGQVKPDRYTKSIGGMHVYDSIIVFDKAKVERPTHERTGLESFQPYLPERKRGRRR